MPFGASYNIMSENVICASLDKIFQPTSTLRVNQHLNVAVRLATELDEFWDLNNAPMIGNLNFTYGKEDPLYFRMKDDFWYRCFIRTGMLQYCHALLEGTDDGETLSIKKTLNEINKILLDRVLKEVDSNDGVSNDKGNQVTPSVKMALVDGRPKILRLLGHRLMYFKLVKSKRGIVTVRNGDEVILNP